VFAGIVEPMDMPQRVSARVRLELKRLQLPDERHTMDDALEWAILPLENSVEVARLGAKDRKLVPCGELRAARVN
jgi:hypothetical protein